jgi:hypothetical protein
MTTFTSTAAASAAPVYEGSGNQMCCAHGYIDVAANPVAADIYRMCKLPAGAVVVGGRIWSGDLDTNATETLDLDIGWEANGSDAADPDGFGNLGVLGTDTVAGVKPEAGYNFAFGGVLNTEGPKTFARETMVTVTCVATAATFAAGRLSVAVYYINP